MWVHHNGSLSDFWCIVVFQAKIWEVIFTFSSRFFWLNRQRTSKRHNYCTSVWRCEYIITLIYYIFRGFISAHKGLKHWVSYCCAWTDLTSHFVNACAYLHLWAMIINVTLTIFVHKLLRLKFHTHLMFYPYWSWKIHGEVCCAR